MGELADDFRFMKEQRLKERKAKEPKRVDYAFNLLKEAGYKVRTEGSELVVSAGQFNVKVYPYTGWWTGRVVGSGRGIHNLVKRLEALGF